MYLLSLLSLLLLSFTAATVRQLCNSHSTMSDNNMIQWHTFTMMRYTQNPREFPGFFKYKYCTDNSQQSWFSIFVRRIINTY